MMVKHQTPEGDKTIRQYQQHDSSWQRQEPLRLDLTTCRKTVHAGNLPFLWQMYLERGGGYGVDLHKDSKISGKLPTRRICKKVHHAQNGVIAC